jgi:MFS family permease
MNKPAAPKGPKNIFGMSPNVFFLGMVSLLTDVSSEMIFTLVPLFLKNVLGASTSIIGLVGGLSDSTEGVFKIFSGWFSDRINKPKLMAVLGYSFSTLVKPFMLLANAWGLVAGVRLGDRVGKGVRTAPRDALVADSVTSDKRGRGFGLHRAMDTTGAVLGLAAAACIIYRVQGGGIDLTLRSYRWMVLGGIVPAVLAVLVLLVFVRERRRSQPGRPPTAFSLKGLGAGFDARFKIFLAIMAVFTLGNSSDFFLILRAQNINAPLIQVVLMLVLFNVVYAGTALPMGILSDRLGRRRVMAAGWLVYGLVYLGFALATHVWQAWVLFAVYGVYYGMVEGVGKAFVADLVPAERRGTAYGLYNGVLSLALLPASVIAGALWSVNPSVTFYFGGGLALIAVVGMMLLIREPSRVAVG